MISQKIFDGRKNFVQGDLSLNLFLRGEDNEFYGVSIASAMRNDPKIGGLSLSLWRVSVITL